MDENQKKLKELIGKGIKISKFVSFEAECERLLGVEINPIIDYFVHNYPTTRDKFLLTFEDFIDITQKWANSGLAKADLENEEEVEYDHLEEEKLEMQVKSKDNLVLKFDKHAEKIREIFEKYSEPAEKEIKSKSLRRESRDSKRLSAEEKKEMDSFREHESENELKSYRNLVPHAKLKNLGKIFDDMAYLTSISMMTYMEYLEGMNTKKFSNKAKEEIAHFIWK